jgi:hypothetical protein
VAVLLILSSHWCADFVLCCCVACRLLFTAGDIAKPNAPHKPLPAGAGETC